jgi:uncharacterized protein
MSINLRPEPRRGVYEVPFWDHVSQHELKLQNCSECGHFRYPPGPTCPECLSMNYEWTSVSGKGRLCSWVVFRKQYFPEFPVPYVVGAVELDEGPILIANIQNAKPEELRLDLPIEICYEQVKNQNGDEWTIYQWSLLKAND